MQNEQYYGGQRPAILDDPAQRHLEELAVLGYTVVPEVVAQSELARWRECIDDVYKRQEAEVGGRAALAEIGEQDVCRAPLLYDHAFLSMARNEKVLSLVRKVLGDWFVLNLQNAIINRPGEPHHQSAWHRDLPYQNWVCSKPLAIGALFAVDPFADYTGGTVVLPHSHQRETIPSETYIRSHAVTIDAEPGSVLLFDAMIFHRSGHNRSEHIRRGVNHLYTIPLLRQQYDFPRALGDDFHGDEPLRQLLGYTSATATDVLQWRTERRRRLAAQ
jgi:ectoine hydroxylase-related dioxygenase (phytanoyl-CoA dioxygenase family)